VDISIILAVLTLQNKRQRGGPNRGVARVTGKYVIFLNVKRTGIRNAGAAQDPYPCCRSSRPLLIIGRGCPLRVVHGDRQGRLVLSYDAPRLRLGYLVFADDHPAVPARISTPTFLLVCEPRQGTLIFRSNSHQYSYATDDLISLLTLSLTRC